MCKINDHLERAKASIDAIDFSQLVKSFSEDKGVYSMAGGTIVATLMHDEDGAEILILTMEPESLIPLHEHNEKETYFVLSGNIELRKKGKVIHLEAGDSCYTLPNIPHTSFSKDGCRMILVRTPSSKEQRNGNQ